LVCNDDRDTQVHSGKEKAMRYSLFGLCVVVAAIAAAVSTVVAEREDAGFFFSESFDDAEVAKRG